MKKTKTKNLPDKLEHITVRDYLMIQEIINQYGEDDGKTQYEIIKYFMKGDDLPVNVGTAFVENLMAQLMIDPRFISRFEYDGISYGFIPNFDKITTGEYIDIEAYQDNINNIPKLLSILYRPIVGEVGKDGSYKIEEYNGTINSEIMLNVSIEIYLGCIVFFYNLSNEITNYFSIYSNNPKKIMMKKTTH
jgi:hypothetical protein